MLLQICPFCHLTKCSIALQLQPLTASNYLTTGGVCSNFKVSALQVTSVENLKGFKKWYFYSLAGIF